MNVERRAHKGRLARRVELRRTKRAEPKAVRAGPTEQPPHISNGLPTGPTQRYRRIVPFQRSMSSEPQKLDNS